jgi:hypothetical protein
MKKSFVILAVVALIATQFSNVNATEYRGKPKSRHEVSNSTSSSPLKNPTAKSNKSATTNTTKKEAKSHSCCTSHNAKANSEKKVK